MWNSSWLFSIQLLNKQLVTENQGNIYANKWYFMVPSIQPLHTAAAVCGFISRPLVFSFFPSHVTDFTSLLTWDEVNCNKESWSHLKCLQSIITLSSKLLVNVNAYGHIKLKNHKIHKLICWRAVPYVGHTSVKLTKWWDLLQGT